jgi:hypothetical protein
VATDTVHSLALAQIESEVMAKHGSLMAEESVPNQVYMVVVSRK